MTTIFRFIISTSIKYSSLLLIFVQISMYSCGEKTTQSKLGNIEIKAYEIGSTEILLELDGPLNSSSKNNLILTRDNKPVVDFIKSKDGLIADQNLEPNQKYIYKVLIEEGGEITSISNQLVITTLDTSARIFEWYLYRFGDSGSSNFMDAWITNEDKIYAVGEVRLNDNTRKNTSRVSGLYWEDNQWNPLKVYFRYGTSDEVAKILSIEVLENSEYWFAWGSVFYWDGQSAASESYIRDSSTGDRATIIWAENSNRIYAAGTNGLLLFHNGLNWWRYETDFNVPVNDLWGFSSEDDEGYVMGIASNTYTFDNEYLFRIVENSIQYENLPQSNYFSHIQPNSIWFNSRSHLFLGGNGLYVRYFNNQWVEIPEFRDLPYINRIRGSAPNNIYVAHDTGLISHYNGHNWRVNFRDIKIKWNQIRLKNNKVIIVGNDSRYAYVLIGETL